MNTELELIRKEIAAHRDELQGSFNVRKIGVFGSVAKGIPRTDSDIDLLVELSAPIGLFRFESLRMFLESFLGKKVDLATPRALKPIVREGILNGVIYL